MNHTSSKLIALEKSKIQGYRKNVWTIEEDELLKLKVEECGTSDWIKISQNTGRNAKQCRERWCHQLNSKLNKGEWTKKEDEIILDAQIKMGHKWSKIALLVNRAPIDVKNRFNKLKRKKVSLQSLKRLIESNERILPSSSSSNYFSPSISQSTSCVSSPREQISCIADNSHQLPMYSIIETSQPDACSYFLLSDTQLKNIILPSDSKDESNIYFGQVKNELVYNTRCSSDNLFNLENIFSGITDGLEDLDAVFSNSSFQNEKSDDSSFDFYRDTIYYSFGSE